MLAELTAFNVTTDSNATERWLVCICGWFEGGFKHTTLSFCRPHMPIYCLLHPSLAAAIRVCVCVVSICLILLLLWNVMFIQGFFTFPGSMCLACWQHQFNSVLVRWCCGVVCVCVIYEFSS